MAEEKERWALEFHDSELKEIKVQGGSIELVLDPAILHKSAGRPGWDSGSTWTQAICIVIGDANLVSGQVSERGALDDGSLTINGKTHANVVDLPLEQKGRIQLECRPMYSTSKKLVVSGGSVRIERKGQPEHNGSFPGTKSEE